MMTLKKKTAAAVFLLLMQDKKKQEDPSNRKPLHGKEKQVEQRSQKPGQDRAKQVESRRQKARTRPYLDPWETQREGTCELLIKELREDISGNCPHFLGMKEENFNRLFELCKPFIEIKQDTVMRQSITQKEKLVATLVYLTSGESKKNLPTYLSISTQSLCKLIPATCDAIITALAAYMKLPTTAEQWKRKSLEFSEKWEFPNCVGVVGGKHVKVLRPSMAETRYQNYRNSSSVLFIAVVDANLEFMMVDTETGGSTSGQGALENTQFYAKLQLKALNLPNKEDNANGLNSVFIGEEAFASHENFLTPFTLTELSEEKSVYNYRLSRARQCVENAFRIMSHRFKVLSSTMVLQVPKVRKIVLASCLLHNFMMRECKERYMTSFQPGQDLEYGDSIVFNYDLSELESVDEAFIPLEKGVQKTYEAAESVRNEYVEFFNNIASYYPE